MYIIMYTRLCYRFNNEAISLIKGRLNVYSSLLFRQNAVVCTPGYLFQTSIIAKACEFFTKLLEWCMNAMLYLHIIYHTYNEILLKMKWNTILFDCTSTVKLANSRTSLYCHFSLLAWIKITSKILTRYILTHIQRFSPTLDIGLIFLLELNI